MICVTPNYCPISRVYSSEPNKAPQSASGIRLEWCCFLDCQFDVVYAQISNIRDQPHTPFEAALCTSVQQQVQAPPSL